MGSESDARSPESQTDSNDAALEAKKVELGRVLAKVSLRLIPFMLILYVAAYLDRINVSFAGLQMNRELGFSDQVFGLGAGIFFVGYFIFGVPANMMIERFGARRWISLIMVCWGSISISMTQVSSEIGFYVLRFLLGVAEAGFFPGMILFLTFWFPKREHGMAVARFMTAIPAAGVLGGIVASRVLTMTGVGGLSGWKWLFLTTGSLSALLGVAVFFYLSDGPHQAKWLTEPEKEILLEAVAADRSVGSGAHVAKVNPLTCGRVWLLAAIYFLFSLNMYGFQLWLPQIIKSLGDVSDSVTALLSAIPAVFQAAGMLVVAGLSDRKSERQWHVACSVWLAAAGLLIASVATNPIISLLALSITAFGLWGVVGPFWAIPTATLPRAAAAGGIALINSVGNLGGFVGSTLIGYIKGATGSFFASLAVLAVTLILAGFLVLVTRQPMQTRDG